MSAPVPPCGIPDHLKMTDTRIDAPKMFREMHDIEIENVEMTDADEVFWRCNRLNIKNLEAARRNLSVYVLQNGLRIDGLESDSKYVFQYVKNMELRNAKITTKDAVGNGKRDGLRFRAERRIPGLALAQPASGELQNFRYAAPVLCGKPVLENCVMADDCDLAFEYSSVHATIDSPVRSVKNPRSGRIIAESYGEIILDKHIKAPADCALKPGTNGLVSPPDNFRTGRWERETTIPITFYRSSAKEKR